MISQTKQKNEVREHQRTKTKVALPISQSEMMIFLSSCGADLFDDYSLLWNRSKIEEEALSEKPP